MKAPKAPKVTRATLEARVDEVSQGRKAPKAEKGTEVQWAYPVARAQTAKQVKWELPVLKVPGVQMGKLASVDRVATRENLAK